MDSTTGSTNCPERSAMPPNDKTISDSPVIRVAVGEEPDVKEFSVNEALLRSHSKFFENAMKKEWKEAEERKVTLSEDEPEVFSFYLEIISFFDTENLDNQHPFEYPAHHTNEKSSLAEWGTKMCKLYVLAERLMDDSTKTEVLTDMSTVYEHSYTHPDLEAVRIVYNGTPSGDPARKLLIALYSKSSRGPDFNSDRGGITTDQGFSEFLQDLVKNLFRTRLPADECEDLETRNHILLKEVHRLEQKLGQQEDAYAARLTACNDVNERYDQAEEDRDRYRRMAEEGELEIKEKDNIIRDLEQTVKETRRALKRARKRVGQLEAGAS